MFDQKGRAIQCSAMMLEGFLLFYCTLQDSIRQLEIKEIDDNLLTDLQTAIGNLSDSSTEATVAEAERLAEMSYAFTMEQLEHKNAQDQAIAAYGKKVDALMSPKIREFCDKTTMVGKMEFSA